LNEKFIMLAKPKFDIDKFVEVTKKYNLRFENSTAIKGPSDVCWLVPTYVEVVEHPDPKNNEGKEQQTKVTSEKCPDDLDEEIIENWKS
ncbi:Uncharacterized protein FWK35_00035710, partial [Aphis craccivora]